MKDRQKLRKMQCPFLRHDSAFFDVTGVIGRRDFISELIIRSSVNLISQHGRTLKTASGAMSFLTSNDITDVI